MSSSLDLPSFLRQQYHSKLGRNGKYATKRRRKSAVILSTLQEVDKLAQLPNTESAVWDLLTFLCKESLLPSTGSRPAYYREVQVMHEKLDDLLVSAILRRPETEPLEDLWALLESLTELKNKRKDLADCIGWSGCQRSVVLLESFRTEHLANVLADCLLRSSPLPAEVVTMVCRAVFAQRNIPWDFRRTLSTFETRPDPPKGHVRHCQQRMCSASSEVRWWTAESRWVQVHQWKWNCNMPFVCTLATCDGHHHDASMRQAPDQRLAVEKALSSPDPADLRKLARW